MHGTGWYNSASGPEHVITGGIKIEFEWKRGRELQYKKSVAESTLHLAIGVV